jgi:formylglycine-generating enzyme required for sulfatase activity
MAVVCLAATGQFAGRGGASASEIDAAVHTVSSFNFRSLRQAVVDLSATFGDRYPQGSEFGRRLDELEAASKRLLAMRQEGGHEFDGRIGALAAELSAFRAKALLANPLLDFDRLLVVKRACSVGTPRYGRASDFYGHFPFYTAYGRELALPTNHNSLAGVNQMGWDNEIAVVTPVRPDGRLTTVYRPPGSEYVGEIELHWDAGRLLFSMARGGRYGVYEVYTNGTGLRQVTPDDQPDVDNFDATYLPNGRVLFCGTASYQSVPCWNGLHAVPNLYSINPDGSGMRQLTFDQDEASSPTMLNTGQVLYSRWQYTNTTHVYGHILFQMNPDGTGQREFYGSNSYWPNGLYFARPVPEHPSRVATILSGYHGDHRMGELLVLDTAKGRYGETGVVQRIPGYGRAVEPRIEDRLTSGSWPKFLHPYPLSDKYFLVSAKVSPEANWCIYLVDIFDNMLMLHAADGYALLEPIPVRRNRVPPVVPEKIDPRRSDGIVYMHDVYAGPGLSGVPRGAVKRLRVHSYHFAYLGVAGLDKVGIEGPWDVMRILGTVPVDTDGSAMFRVPANTPIAVQPLDEQGRALQVMRSWFTLMPGEVRSCVGCHEPQNTLAAVKRTTAATRAPSEVEPWYGPPRGFDFEREVQPVLTKYCAGCHDGSRGRPDLRSKEHFPAYEGVYSDVPDWWSHNVPQVFKQELLGSRNRKRVKVQFTPAYEELQKYVRRNGPEGDYMLPNPAEFHVNTSELIQMLEKGHHNVRLDQEAWDRLITWIDLNVPCHGTWGQILPIPFNGRQRRLELAKLYANMNTDPEEVPEIPRGPITFVKPEANGAVKDEVHCPGWPFNIQEARERQRAAGFPDQRLIELAPSVKLKLVLIPAGEFLMGDAAGSADERPVHRVRIDKPFWMGAFEVTNEQYALFDPAHDSGYINESNKITVRPGRGYAVDGAQQPVVRVSWERVMAFCGWLSKKTGMRFRLPSEAQWEWAARAGTAAAFFFGDSQTAFSQWANMADQSIMLFYENARGQGSEGGILRTSLSRPPASPVSVGVGKEWMLYDPFENDGAMVSAPVGTYLPNPWGLCDMHGNAAEWTISTYAGYSQGQHAGGSDNKVVRGGSWSDRPYRCRSGFRLAYPSWQRVYNVGFRVISDAE